MLAGSFRGRRPPQATARNNSNNYNKHGSNGIIIISSINME